jgi:hypothetical protein
MPGYPTGSTARPFPFFRRLNGFIHPMDLC